MKTEDINPYIRFFWTRTVGGDYTEELLAYDFRIFYCLSGCFILEAEGKSLEVHPNTFAIVPPATPYTLKRHPQYGDDHLFCIFNFDMNCRRSDHELSLRPQPLRNFEPSLIISTDSPPETAHTVIFEGDHHTGDLIKEISQLFSTRPRFYREESGALLKQIITRAMRKTSEKNTSGPKIINDIISYIREHYREPITNADIAKHFKYHPNHISRLFKAETGKSLHNYIISYRLKIAKELLVNTDCKIEEAARSAGFESASYFSKYFGREFGESPLKFRNDYVRNNEHA